MFFDILNLIYGERQISKNKTKSKKDIQKGGQR